MKTSELKTKTPDQLKELVSASKKELFNLRFQQAAGEAKNTARFRVVRRTVARAKTLLKQQTNA